MIGDVPPLHVHLDEPVAIPPGMIGDRIELAEDAVEHIALLSLQG